MMPDYSVETLILGATFYGCGLASRVKNSLLVESSIAVGSDYAFALQQGRNWDEPLSSAAAEEFRSELIKRHALEDNKLVPAALAPVLGNWCKKHDVQPLLGLEFISRKGNIYTFVDWCGKKISVAAEKVIDARCGAGKVLSAVILAEKVLADGVYECFTIKSTPAAKLYTLELMLPENCTPAAARQLLAEKWATRPTELADVKMIWSAARLSSNEFANAAAALDFGLNCDIKYADLPEAPPPEETGYDVVVAGLGTGGIIAAISAARQGAKVLAIEKNFYPGGVWTGGFVARSYIQQVGGLARELQDRSEALEGYYCMSENLKMVLESTALESNVTIEYGSVICDVEKDQQQVKKLTYRNSSGKLCKVSAYTFIDSTGDAALCRMADAPLSCGRAVDREFNCFTSSMAKLTDMSFYVSNFDAGRAAQYDAEDFSRSFFQALEVHLKDDYSIIPVCVQLSDNPGVREGLRIVPEKPYTIKDYFEQKGNCDEAFFQVISNLDTHAQDLFFESEDYQDWTIAASCWEVRVKIPVPMSLLFPKGVHGVIVAARHLGTDHDLGCALRMITLMTAAGELAGNLAVEAQKRSILPHEVKFESIKARIPAMPGVYDSIKNKIPSGDLNAYWHSASNDDIKAGLAGDDPALAIWNVKQQNKISLAWELFSNAAENTSLRVNSALALALAGDERSAAALLKIVENKETVPVNQTLRFSAQRRVAAVYLLGRLRFAGAVELLLNSLDDQGDEKFFGHVVMALMRIGEAHSQCRKQIGERLLKLAADTSWKMIEQLKGAGAPLRRSDGLLRWHIAKTLDRWQIKHDLQKIAETLELESHERFLWNNYPA